MDSTQTKPESGAVLVRRLGLLGLTATGVCSMMGAAINILPIALLRNVPDIGPYVLPAYFLAAVPAILAALIYASLASGMPRAGGSYIFASRSLHPYLGFVASFSQWFGLSIAIGVISYVIIFFLRDVADALGMASLSAFFVGDAHVFLSLAFLWFFVWVNLRGLDLYERLLIPLMFLMFAGAVVVIFAGFGHDQQQFLAAVEAREGVRFVPQAEVPAWDLWTMLSAAAVLFGTFIGFDSIAQAGGEAKRPERNLPLAIGLAIGIVGGLYLLFTAAIYHVVPWSFVAERVQEGELTAPGLLGYVLAPGWTVVILAAAAIALINDLPAMLLAVSRLMFAWAEDEIFPAGIARIHPRYKTPWVAVVLSAATSSLGILGCHFAGDFFLGVDILVTSMLVNFFFMALSLMLLSRRNPKIAARVRFVSSTSGQAVLGFAGILVLGLFAVVHVHKDLSADLEAWYFHSTWTWLIVMALASCVFTWKWFALKARGVNLKERFEALPPQ